MLTFVERKKQLEKLKEQEKEKLNKFRLQVSQMHISNCPPIM